MIKHIQTIRRQFFWTELLRVQNLNPLVADVH